MTNPLSLKKAFAASRPNYFVRTMSEQMRTRHMRKHCSRVAQAFEMSLKER